MKRARTSREVNGGAVLATVMVITVMFALMLKSYRNNYAVTMYMNNVDDIREMQDQIGNQMGMLERNITEVGELLTQLLKGNLDNNDVSDVNDLEDLLISKIGTMKKNFDDQAKELQEMSKTNQEYFRQLIDDSAKAASSGIKPSGGELFVSPGTSKWLVKWHNNGISTSPLFESEGVAYQYYVNIGDYAKKLIAYDGHRWILLKSYGGQQWVSLMTDDGTIQNG
eukprot:TRINITY_DN14350_c0_g1_i1.p1 TRINITY_DN14350_c0_g1~~TRINITY_DN14350_c0_g1_i1.p1  ORF type:complete len:253 (+),score=33.11 TRINITY_DN14350_c0_g1_i1:85-759(+)